MNPPAAIHRSMRVVLLIDDRELMEWEVRVIEELRRDHIAEIVGVVRNKARSRRKPDVRHIPYYVLRWLLARPRCWRSRADYAVARLGCATLDVVPGVQSNGRQTIPPAAARWIDGLKPDMVLRFGFGILSGAILDSAPLGVWSFHHGDVEQFRGRPAGFWELRTRAPVVGVTLQRLGSKLDAGVVLGRAWFPVIRWSWSATLERMYLGSVHLVRNAAIAARDEHGSAERGMVAAGRLYRAPRLYDVLVVAASLSASAATHLWYGAFLEKRWRVGLTWRAPSRPPWLVEAVTWVSTRNAILADPSILSEEADGSAVVLCEHLADSETRGEIYRIDVDRAGGSAAPVRVINEARSHLSFPGLFEFEGSQWCVPEQADTGEIAAYRLSPDGRAVIEQRSVMKDIRAVDPSIFFHAGRWWLFLAPSGMFSSIHLLAFYASSPFGPWRSHSLNPVVADVRCARLAGKPFRWNGKLYRPGQDASAGYGGAVSVREITRLDPLAFDERAVARVSGPVSGYGADGVHSLSVGKAVVAIDGCEHRFTWSAGVRRLVHRVAQAGRRAGRGRHEAQP
jgi:hypothetical protein